MFRARFLAIALAVSAGAISVSTGASAQTVQFFAVLAGGNETAAADNNGQGVATVMFGAPGQVCFSILARMIAAPTVAHIHEARAGKAGAIRLTLTTPTAAGNGAFVSSGCKNVTGSQAEAMTRLRSTPSNFYINVHNADFEDGAIRGQLF